MTLARWRILAYLGVVALGILLLSQVSDTVQNLLDRRDRTDRVFVVKRVPVPCSSPRREAPRRVAPRRRERVVPGVVLDRSVGTATRSITRRVVPGVVLVRPPVAHTHHTQTPATRSPAPAPRRPAPPRRPRPTPVSPPAERAQPCVRKNGKPCKPAKPDKPAKPEKQPKPDKPAKPEKQPKPDKQPKPGKQK